MSRAPFQVLVLPYRKTQEAFEFAVLSRLDDACWQGIAGGGEDQETPIEAARREAWEEACIPSEAKFLPLDALCSIPAPLFRDSALWGEELYVIPEYSFGADCTGREITLSSEHTGLEWRPYAEAHKRLTYDSNRVALWELHQRIQGLGPREV